MARARIGRIGALRHHCLQRSKRRIAGADAVIAAWRRIGRAALQVGIAGGARILREIGAARNLLRGLLRLGDIRAGLEDLGRERLIGLLRQRRIGVEDRLLRIEHLLRRLDAGIDRGCRRRIRVAGGLRLGFRG
ncbi:MAG TPA: hypothetical protein VNT42_05200 [Sphingomonas sp.]|nr:hypothetical protein [Sphingomonas sp.]